MIRAFQFYSTEKGNPLASIINIEIMKTKLPEETILIFQENEVLVETYSDIYNTIGVVDNTLIHYFYDNNLQLLESEFIIGTYPDDMHLYLELKDNVIYAFYKQN